MHINIDILSCIYNPIIYSRSPSLIIDLQTCLSSFLRKGCANYGSMAQHLPPSPFRSSRAGKKPQKIWVN